MMRFIVEEGEKEGGGRGGCLIEQILKRRLGKSRGGVCFVCVCGKGRGRGALSRVVCTASFSVCCVMGIS